MIIPKFSKSKQINLWAVKVSTHLHSSTLYTLNDKITIDAFKERKEGINSTRIWVSRGEGGSKILLCSGICYPIFNANAMWRYACIVGFVQFVLCYYVTLIWTYSWEEEKILQMQTFLQIFFSKFVHMNRRSLSLHNNNEDNPHFF